MIAAASHWRDLDVALMIFLLAVAMFVPDIIKRVRNYLRSGQISSEPEAPRLFDQDDWDDWR